jgi:RimJ/RimL family protein N-acetyltransferase
MYAFRPPQIIETDDLILRPPRANDAQALFDDFFSDTETMRDLTTPRHTRLEQTIGAIEQSIQGWHTGLLIRWLLEDKKTHRLIGMIELRPSPPRVELGLMSCRRGAWFYAVRKVIEWTIAQPLIFRVYATCAVDGAAHSWMERIGFTREAMLKNYECRPNVGVVAGDSYLFAMTRPAPRPISDGFLSLPPAAPPDRPAD